MPGLPPWQPGYAPPPRHPPVMPYRRLLRRPPTIGHSRSSFRPAGSSVILSASKLTPQYNRNLAPMSEVTLTGVPPLHGPRTRHSNVPVEIPVMSAKPGVVSLAVVFLWTAVGSAGPGPLDLIPEDAGAAVAVR